MQKLPSPVGPPGSHLHDAAEALLPAAGCESHGRREEVGANLQHTRKLQELERPAGTDERRILLKGLVTPGSEEEVGRHHLLQGQDHVREGAESSLTLLLHTAPGRVGQEGDGGRQLQQLLEGEEGVEVPLLRLGDRQAVLARDPGENHGERQGCQGGQPQRPLSAPHLRKGKAEEQGQGAHLQHHVQRASQGAVQMVDVPGAHGQDHHTQIGRKQQEGRGEA
mmetsp:Transcript_116771/g.341884  ORF Transcript_116771/g.341884 Transcript_116771/m.341884 type:complete len:223 (-) Transcript_116771:548-1216(-)